MDKNLAQVVEKRIRRTIEALEKNNMQGFYAPAAQDAVKIAAGLVKEGDLVTNGGSMTLRESGVLDMLKSGACNYVDRDAPGISPQQREEAMRRAFFADAYFTSANAVTEQGELFCVDGYGNRIAAMIFGPQSVVAVVGYNKIVDDMRQAEERLRSVAAPANAIRLNCGTPCAKTGRCTDCRSESRICRSYVRFGPQAIKNRIKVIIVGEQLGY